MQMMPCDIKSPQTKRKVLWYNFKIGNVVYDLVLGGKKHTRTDSLMKMLHQMNRNIRRYKIRNMTSETVEVKPI